MSDNTASVEMLRRKAAKADELAEFREKIAVVQLAASPSGADVQARLAAQMRGVAAAYRQQADKLEAESP